MWLRKQIYSARASARATFRSHAGPAVFAQTPAGGLISRPYFWPTATTRSMSGSD
jgi:hypothetical protein